MHCQGASVDPCSPGMLKCLMKIPDSLWSREAGRLGADERIDLWKYYLQLGKNELCAYTAILQFSRTVAVMGVL